MSVQMVQYYIKAIRDKVPDLPERAEEFGSSVEEKAEAIGEWVEQNERVTEKQLSALKNMVDGVDRWICRD